MALTSNQGLELPDGTDNANVPLSMTQYNTGVENRLVQRYLSIADRTARNPAPAEGELSYLADLNIYEFFQPVTGWLPLIGQYSYATSTVSYSTASAVYTTVGAAVIGLTLRAASSGRLRVGWGALMNHGGVLATYIAPQLNAGAVIGAGAVVQAASDNAAAVVSGGAAMVSSAFVAWSGLTPGASYNVFLMHHVTGGTGNIVTRHLEISQR